MARKKVVLRIPTNFHPNEFVQADGAGGVGGNAKVGDGHRKKVTSSDDDESPTASKRQRVPGAKTERLKCDLKKRCSLFLDTLKLNPAYFESDHDRCYCPTCATADGVPDVLEMHSAHGNKYEVPKGALTFDLPLTLNSKV
jgi:hypothetical protein